MRVFAVDQPEEQTVLADSDGDDVGDFTAAVVVDDEIPGLRFGLELVPRAVGMRRWYGPVLQLRIF